MELIIILCLLMLASIIMLGGISACVVGGKSDDVSRDCQKKVNENENQEKNGEVLLEIDADQAMLFNAV